MTPEDVAVDVGQGFLFLLLPADQDFHVPARVRPRFQFPSITSGVSTRCGLFLPVSINASSFL
jgi:hypothetical protein